MIAQSDARPNRVVFEGTGKFLKTVRTRVDAHLAYCQRSDVGIPPMSRGDKLEFWVSKVGYYAVFVALPFAFFAPRRVVVGLLLFHVVLSLSLTFIFNLAHATAKANFPVPSGSRPRSRRSGQPTK